MIWLYVAIGLLLLAHTVAAWCFGVVAWQRDKIYVAGWRRWLIRRGVAWQESGFPGWAKTAWRAGQALSFGSLPAGLAYCAADALIGGVGEQSSDRRAKIRKGADVYVEVMGADDFWERVPCRVVDLLDGPLGPSAVVEFAAGGHRGAKGTKYANSDKHDMLPVSCLGVP